MPIDKKIIVKNALIIALEVAKCTSNPIDDIIVTASCAILNRVFDLGMEL